MPGQVNAVHGVISAILINTTPMKVESATFKGKITTDDVTSTDGDGWQQIIGGVKSGDVSVSGPYDFDFDYSVLEPGLSVTAFHVKPDGVVDYHAEYLVTAFQFTAGPKPGAVRVSIDLMSNGPVTYPAAP